MSNFRPAQIEKLIAATGVIPAVNQGKQCSFASLYWPVDRGWLTSLLVEAHPLLNQQSLLDYCTSKGIHMTAYMPFGGDAKRGATKVLGNRVVEEVARKAGKQAGQVLVSWGIKVSHFQ